MKKDCKLHFFDANNPTHPINYKNVTRELAEKIFQAYSVKEGKQNYFRVECYPLATFDKNDKTKNLTDKQVNFNAAFAAIETINSQASDPVIQFHINQYIEGELNQTDLAPNL